MTITAIFVLFSIVWFLVLFLTLQINIKTQADVGEIVKGTHASAPVDFDLKKRLLITTAVAIPLCALVVLIITSGILSLDMFDFYSVIEK